MTSAIEVRLASYAVGRPTVQNFAIAEVELQSPAPGQLLLRNVAISVDPYMRWRMSAARSYAQPYELGKAMDGGAVGVVVESNIDGFRAGDHVLHGLGWRSHALVDARDVSIVDPLVAPVSSYLGVLGMTGMTAYVGLSEIARVAAGDTVFVSGAAGAVGSAAGQLARLKGARRVVGSAGSDEKVRHLVEHLGFDAAFNYHRGPISEQLQSASPEGIDVYFDNVGGDHLEAAIESANLYARLAICGMISISDQARPPAAPHNLSQIIGKRLTLRGFLVGDHAHLRDQFMAEVAPLVKAGDLLGEETLVEGIHNAPQAFLDMLAGVSVGKMIVLV